MQRYCWKKWNDQKRNEVQEADLHLQSSQPQQFSQHATNSIHSNLGSPL